MPYPKRLIEVDLPIKRISAHARREKSIRHGHISTLHIWWARRPLAACRAVVCASLWPDPADELCPQEFRERATEIVTTFVQKTDSPYFTGKVSPESEERWRGILKSEVPLDATNSKHWNVLRGALLDFIADFANWDNSTHEDFLEASRALTQAAHEALGGEPGTRPLVVDPFAGGGSIPLEALRVGADAFASDLNPVAVLLNKVVLEYIPQYGQQLAGEVREWGQWIKEEAEKELAEFYPKDLDESTPIAYLWARTITCEGPSCGMQVPMLRTLKLSKKRGKSVFVKLTGNPKSKDIHIDLISESNKKERIEGTVRKGSVTCPVCGYTTPVSSVRKQLMKKKGGTRDSKLVCVVTNKDNVKHKTYRLPNDRDFNALKKTSKELEERRLQRISEIGIIPDEKISLNEIRRISVPLYGMTSWEDIFTDRQLLLLVTLIDLNRRVYQKLAAKDEFLATAVSTCLALSIGRGVDYWSSLATWAGDFVAHTFGRQALPFVNDYAEVSPLTNTSGSFEGAIDWIYRFISREATAISNNCFAQVVQVSASEHPLPDDSCQVLCTDPPYYDAVPYAYLSDYFYVWLRRSLVNCHSDLFSQVAVPKNEEIVVDRSHELSKSNKGVCFYEEKLRDSFQHGRRYLAPDGIGVIVFANKNTSSWEAVLQAIIDGGLVITASWPIDTERQGRVSAKDQARLQSSIHIVCRPRENPDGSLREEIGDWGNVLQELPHRIHQWMPHLTQEGVVGADAIFACLGPALEIFSRYSSVEKASGEEVTLREYLEYVWGAVSKEALGMIFDDADTIDFEEDARLTAIWFWVLKAANQDANNSQKTETPEEEPVDDNSESQDTKSKKSKSGYSMEYDAVRKLAQGLGADLQKLSRPGGIVIIKGNLATLNNVNLRESYLLGQQLSLFGDSKEIRSKGKRKSSQNPTVKLKDLDARQLSLLPQDSQYAANDDDLPLIPGLLPDQKAVPLLEQLLSNGSTTLDRLHQAMLLFGRAQTPLLKPFLEKCGMGDDPRFWKLAQALSALYPSGTDEKRWVDGVLARKKGLGF